MTMNIQYYVDFFRDWNKQIAIINTITRDGFENKITFIQDNTFSALSRDIGNYEWEGLDLPTIYGGSVKWFCQCNLIFRYRGPAKSIFV